jgi:peptide deformylase
MEIKTLGDPVLREKCRQVEAVDDEVADLIEKMSETLRASPGRVGLAASQVGVLKKLFVYDLGFGNRCLINPEIIEIENETFCEEGCLSIPGIYISVKRYERVKVKCKTLSGHNIVIEAEGFLAQVLQHECDHLEGVLIIDRCDPAERKRAMEEYQELSIRREQVTA